MNDRHEHHHPAETFEETLKDTVRRTPWLFASLVFHGVLLVVLAQFSWSVAMKSADDAEFRSGALDVSEPFDPPEPPVYTKVERPEVVELPTVSEVVLDHTFVDPNPDPDPDPSPIDAPFQGIALNDVLGVGVGCGGTDGGGSGSGSGRRSDPRQPGRAVVDRGLDWLARHQDPRGFWSSEGFSNMCETNRCDGEGSAVHDVGVTGLSLLAFLGAGHHPGHGRYRRVVSNGLQWLARNQDPETGCFGRPNSHEQFLYDHLLACLAMTEAYGMSHRPTIRPVAQQAVNFVQMARNPYRAWRYHYPAKGDNDVSVTGWAVLALKSARDFGLKVEPAAFDGARHDLNEMTDELTGRTGYVTRGGFSSREPGMNERWPHQETEAMTAVAILSRIMLGEDPARSPSLKAGAARLRKQLPHWDEAAGTVDYYYWYYGSYAMWQLGGRDWDVWQKKLLPAVVETQRRDGDERGSWDPQFDPWGHRGGRVYSTAILTLTMEVYYRYDRILGGR